MKTSRQIICGCRVALLMGMLLLLANALWHPFEPRYDGKRLSVWVKLLSNQLGHDVGDDQLDPVAAHAEAVAAIRHLSIRAWPLAVRYCGARDGPEKEIFLAVAEVDASTKKLKALYINAGVNTNIWREPPKIDVPLE